MNLVSTIMSLLGPAILNKLAGSLGINQGLVGKAVTAAIPAILAGLTSSASRSGGAGVLADVLGKQDPGILGNLGSLIGGANQKSMIDSGSGALSSILGGAGSSALAGAVGKFAGIGGQQSSSLMGMLAPVVLGQLAQTQRASGLDAGGVVNLLASQKDNIAAAMPAGFSDLLSGSGLLDSVAGNLRAAAPQVAPVAPAAPSGGGIGRFLVPLMLAGIAMFLLNTYGCERTAQKVDAPKPVAAPVVTTPAVPAAATAAADLLGLAQKSLTGLTTTIGGIKDEATAKAALPGLGDLAKQFAGMQTTAATLPAEAKSPISMLVKTALPGVTSAIEKAVGIPGVGAIITPALQPIVGSLDALAK